jgi:hypothetical protein
MSRKKKRGKPKEEERNRGHKKDGKRKKECKNEKT